MTTTRFTKEQLTEIIESADDVIKALAGIHDDIHPHSDAMCRAWDWLNDNSAPPEVVKRLAEIALKELTDSDKLAAAEKRNAELERRLSQQQSIAYHNLDLFNRADKQCRLVEKMLAERNAENEGLMLTVGRLRVEKESAEKRIADLDGHKRLIGWRASDYTDETSDPDLAKNWAAAIGVLPIFEGDVNTKLSAAGIGKGE